MRIEVHTPKKPERIVRPWRPMVDLHGRHPRVYRSYRAKITEEQP